MAEQNLVFNIYKEDGTSFNDIVIKSSTYTETVMSLDNNIEGYFYYPNNNLVFTYKEYITYKNVKYYLKIDEPPTIVRKGLVDDDSETAGMTKYTIKFFHPMVLLYNIPFTDVAVSSNESKYKSEDTTFSWIGTLTALVQKINKCLEGTLFTCQLQPNFVDNGTQSDVISFDNQMISDVLKTTYEKFKVPFVVDGYNIFFGTSSNEIYKGSETTPYIFKMGQGLGLKDNDRTPKNNTIITRIACYGSDSNIPNGYPKIAWTGNQTWNYTLNNDGSLPNSYPIIDSVINGVSTRVINHPFTRKYLMPTVYVDSVNKKVNPLATGYNPNIELVDYYDAVNDASHTYPNQINLSSPSYQKHQLEKIKPSIVGAKYNNQEIDILKTVSWINDDGTNATSIDDGYNSTTGKYNQGYFKVSFYPLGFDLYAMAAVTSAMSVNPTSGACNGCKFELGVDWDVVKTNFYYTKPDGTVVFDPTNIYSNHRDYTKFPDSTNQSISVILKKDTSTFGTLMPNIYQQPIVGDKFVFIGIDLPQYYITQAQTNLDEGSKQYMLENNIAYFEYPFTFDEYFLTENQDILAQIKSNSILRFEYGGENIALSIKELTIQWGDKALPEYKITLTDDVSISLNQLGQVTEGLSQLGSQVASIQASYDINITDELNKKVSKIYDDTVNGKITFKNDISVGGVLKVNSLTSGKIPYNTANGLTDSPLYTDGTNVTASVNVTAPTFIGDLTGNAATATKLQTPRTIWGQSFDGSGNVSGSLSLDDSSVYWKESNFGDQFAIVPSFDGIGDSNILCFQSAVGDYGTTPSLSTKMVITGQSGNVGIGTTSPAYKLDVNGTFHASGAVTLSSTLTAAGLITANGGTLTTALTATALSKLAATDILGDAQLSARVMSPDYVSQTTGWGITRAGAADFRNIYADELRVQAFTADISQALAGSDYLTKSVSKLSANFVVPSVNSTVRIIVDDIEGMPATQCFANGDYIRFRAFNRTSGLTIANVWGTVVLDTSYGSNGFLNGTQAYTFTCKATSGAGLTVFKGSEVLDYGTSGSGMIARTTLDAMGSPYEQIATWQTDPSVANNYTVHARLGNLGGIANCNGYGLYTDNGFFTGKIVIGDLTKTANFLSFDSVNGLQIKLGNTSVATTTDVSNAQATAINTASSDATTKANTAYSNAVTYTNTQITATNNSITAAVNGIQIGGRNYMRTDLSPSISNANSDNDLTIVPYIYNGISGYRLTKTKNSSWGSSISWKILNNNLDKNSKWSFSIYVANLGNVSLYYPMDFKNSDSSNIAFGDSINIPLEFKGRIKTEGKSIDSSYDPTLNNTYFVSVIGEVGWDIFIAQPMLEIGSKSTDYSQSIEDVDASISAAQSTAISTAASNAAALYITQTAYNSQVTILQNSINAKVSQTDFNALGTRVGTAESTITQHSTDIASKVSSTDYTGDTIASLINQTATTVTIQANKIDLVGAVTFSSLDNSTQATINNKKETVYNIVHGDGVTSGAFLVATFTINDKYVDRTIKLSAHDRGNTPSNVYIKFGNSSDNDPILDSFKKDGTMQFYMAKVATSTWNLYAGQSEGVWSDVYITDFYNPQPQGIATAWKNGIVSLPSGYITASQMVGTAEWCYNNDLTYINGAHVYTGTLNAISIVANSITSDQIAANAITADKIAANTITADKIAANTITADKIDVNNVSASIANVISLDANRITTGKLSADRIDVVNVVTKGLVAQTIDAQSATISNLNVVNATISGTLNGVSGTFNYLKGVGSSGSLVFGKYGMTFEDEDFSQQGTKNSRALRFYSGNIRCRGSFGTTCLNMARVHDTVIDYYVNGDTDSYVRFNLQSNGVGGYYIPLYPTSDTGYSSVYGNATLGDVYGFPVDLLIFDNSSNYRYEMLAGSTGKKVIVVNAHDGTSDATVYLAVNGNLNWKVFAGKAQSWVNIRELMNPSISSSVHGAGWMLCGEFDNDWA